MAFIYDKNQLQPLSAFAQTNPFGLNNVGNTNPLSFGAQNPFHRFNYNNQADMLNGVQDYTNYASSPANAFGLSSVGVGNNGVYNGLGSFTGNSLNYQPSVSWDTSIEGTSGLSDGLYNQMGLPTSNQGSGIGDWFGKQLENTSLADLTKAGAGLASSLYGIYSSGQQTKMAKQQMSALNDQWQQQWNAQRKLANNQMSDAYEARVKGGGAASRANSESTEDYMKRKGV